MKSSFHPGANTARGASSSLDQQGLWRCLFPGAPPTIIINIWEILFRKSHSVSSRSLRFSYAPAMPTVVGMLVRYPSPTVIYFHCTFTIISQKNIVLLLFRNVSLNVYHFFFALWDRRGGCHFMFICRPLYSPWVFRMSQFLFFCCWKLCSTLIYILLVISIRGKN